MVVYIVHSAMLDKFSIGQTSDFEIRLKKHLFNKNKKSFSATANDWEEFLLIPCETREQAIKIENYIKKQKSRHYIEGLKQNPNWVKNLYSKFPPQ